MATSIDQKINIAIAGGPSTGKSTLAASLFSELKFQGYDYDLISEEARKLTKEFGHHRSPFERFYMWRHQSREEERSSATHGFVTDTPLFHFYASAIAYTSEPRDELAVRELLRMCWEIKDRYQIITILKNTTDIPYKKDECRSGGEEIARKKHEAIETYLRHFLPGKLLYVQGDLKEKIGQVISKMKELRNNSGI